jgi:hypothetical protein
MNIFINIFIPIIATFAISFFLSWLFFKKSRYKKELTPFITNYIKIFTGIKDELRNDLKIKYKDKIIDNFHNIQFTIANTGNSTLINYKKPLTLQLPKETILLKTKILCVHPTGREINFRIKNKKNQSFVEFIFLLLNKNEFFIFEILIGGEINLEDIKFIIESDGLPPILSLVKTEEYSRRDILFYRRMIILGSLFFTLVTITLISKILEILVILPKKIIDFIYMPRPIVDLMVLIIILLITIIGLSYIFIMNRKEKKLDIRYCLNMPKDIKDTYFNKKWKSF